MISSSHWIGCGRSGRSISASCCQITMSACTLHATVRCNASMEMILVVPVALPVTVKLYRLHSFQGSYICHFVNIFGHLCNLFLDLIYACCDTSYTDSDIDPFSANYCARMIYYCQNIPCTICGSDHCNS